jgi:hypothetical protein
LRTLVFRRDAVFREAVLREVVFRAREVVRRAVRFADVRFAEVRFADARFADVRFVVGLFDVLRLRALRLADAPFLRRDCPDSDIAMAIACLRLFTFLPDPLRSEPRLCSPITFFTLRR